MSFWGVEGQGVLISGGFCFRHGFATFPLWREMKPREGSVVVAVTTWEELVANALQQVLKRVYFQQCRECGILLHIYSQACGYHQETNTL